MAAIGTHYAYRKRCFTVAVQMCCSPDQFVATFRAMASGIYVEPTLSLLIVCCRQIYFQCWTPYSLVVSFVRSFVRLSIHSFSLIFFSFGSLTFLLCKTIYRSASFFQSISLVLRMIMKCYATC